MTYTPQLLFSAKEIHQTTLHMDSYDGLGKKDKRRLFLETLNYLENKKVENATVARKIRAYLIKQGDPDPRMNERRIRNIKHRTLVQDEELDAIFAIYAKKLKTFTSPLLPSVEIPDVVKEEDLSKIIEEYEKKIGEKEETIQKLKSILRQSLNELDESE